MFRMNSIATTARRPEKECQDDHAYQRRQPPFSSVSARMRTNPAETITWLM